MAKKSNASSSILTSIPQLNSMLGGGIKKNSLLCVWTKPGLSGSVFAYQLADDAAKNNKVFYVVNAKTPESAGGEMKELGLKKKVFFVDAYSSAVFKKSSAKLVISDPKDVDEVVHNLEIIAKKFESPVIVIDSLSTFVDFTGENTAFIERLKKLRATVICVFTEWPYKKNFIASVRGLFDAIIELKSVQKKLFHRKYFGVSKLTGKAPAKAIPYRVMRPGGVKIYIPKVLVTGPFGAGKTSFIHSSSERAVSVDRLGTTIALDHGHVKYKDFAVDLFGTPGQQRFDPILKLLGGEALGVIVVVSAVDAEGFARALDMVKKAKVYGLPVVFAANKANLRGALSAQQVKKRLGVADEVIAVTAEDLTKVQPGIPCKLKKDDIMKVLDVLFAKLVEGKV
jgi:uncharacterized protein